jgi:uncharacterized protein with HEPN domain
VRSDRLLLLDILDAIREVIGSTPASRREYDLDKHVRSHLVRHIQIIGEAASRLSQDVKEANPHIPWRAIAGMRHVIVHDYFEIDWNEVYNTAIRDVPALQLPILAILDQLPPEAEQPNGG